MESLIFERGDSVFIVAKCSPFNPDANAVEELAFADQLRRMAPNENLLWLKGQYVEADNANANGQMWSSEELAIKALTPNFMPVTVMHDPRTAVGLIADTKLLLPDKDAVPRSRIDSSLAIWQHRFPEVAEEALVNYERGDLMQSMECKSAYYECAGCGKVFQKLPPFDSTGIGRERAQWCSHLNENGRRILGNVVFTGTGLIFGTRGARGAFDKAHLEVFQEEVAEYHEKAHRDTGRHKPTSRRKSVDEITITRSEYDALKQRPTQEAFDAEKARADKAEEEKAEAIRTSEEAEAAKVKAEEEKATLQTKVEEAEEQARQQDLATERLGKLGDGFKGKLGEKTRARLDEQAKSMSDDDWAARVEELSELTGVKPDEGKPEGEEEGKGEEFSSEEIARSQATRTSGAGGNGGGGSKAREVVSGLFSKTGVGAGADKSE